MATTASTSIAAKHFQVVVIFLACGLVLRILVSGILALLPMAVDACRQ
jgi:hypothetical protein